MAEEDVQRFIKQWLVEKLKQKKSARRADDQSFIFLEEDSLKLLFLYLLQRQEEGGTVEKTADFVEVESMMEELLIQLEEVSALLDNNNGEV